MALLDISKPTADKQIKQITSQCVIVMQRTATATYNLFWKSDESPQAIADALGTDAVQAFEVFGLLQDTIMQLNPTWQKLTAPLPFVKNEDGTITIG